MTTIKLIIYAGIRDMCDTPRVDKYGRIMQTTEFYPIYTQCYTEDMEIATVLAVDYPDLIAFKEHYLELQRRYRTLGRYRDAILEFKRELVKSFPQYKFVLDLRGRITEWDWDTLTHPRLDLEHCATPLEYVNKLIELNDQLKIDILEDE
jgi:hypothetical protein